MNQDKEKIKAELGKFEEEMNEKGITVLDPLNVVDNFLNDLNKYERKTWRPKTKLGKKLYNTPLFDANARYYLFHPIKFIAQFSREFKYAWQRAIRGWDERQTWSIDHYYSKIFSELIPYFKKVNNGVPIPVIEMVVGESYKMGGETPEQFQEACELWDEILDEMAEGFAYYYDHEENFYENEDYELIEKKIKRSLELFSKFFVHLWW